MYFANNAILTVVTWDLKRLWQRNVKTYRGVGGGAKIIILPVDNSKCR